jgi:hypothetical protein
VARHAAAGDFVVVTNNASDFRQLYAAQPLHAGLVIIIPSVDRVRQQQLFRGALDELAQIGEPINRVLEVNIESDEAKFRLYEFPAADNLVKPTSRRYTAIGPVIAPKRIIRVAFPGTPRPPFRHARVAARPRSRRPGQTSERWGWRERIGLRRERRLSSEQR